MTTASSLISAPVAEPLSFSGEQKLASCYVLKRRISAGDESVIWIARDEVLDKDVSLHFIPAAVMHDPSVMNAVRQEVKRHRQLIHPNILRIYDLVEEAEWAAISMDAFDGECLAVLLREKGRFDAEQVKSWMTQLCRTLDDAHKIQLVHRNLSLENLFVTSSGKLLLANFGVSRVIQEARARGSESVTDARLATATPQTVEGTAAARSDDIYGIGALMFLLLTGRAAFSGAEIEQPIQPVTPERLSEVLAASDPSTRIPAGWDGLVAACLSKEAAARPQSAAQVLAQIENSPPTPIAVPLPIAEEAPKKTTALETSVGEEAMSLFAAAPPKAAAPAPAPSKGQSNGKSKLLEKARAMKSSQAAPTEKRKEAPPAQKSNPADKKKKSTLEPRGEVYPNLYAPRGSFPIVGLAAAAALIVIGAGGVYLSGMGRRTPAPAEIALTDPAERAELTAVNNAIDPDPLNLPLEAAVAEGAAATPEKTPGGAADKAAAPRVIIAAVADAAAPASNPPPTAAPDANAELAEKAAALEKRKQDAVAAGKAHQEMLKQQQAAAAALAEAQKALDEKAKAAAPMKKVADDLMALRKKREDEQKAAEAAALQAQQMAVEKARAAEDAKKALADLDAQNTDKMAAQEKADAEVQAVARLVSERQKAAGDAAKALADADAARQQQAMALKTSEQEFQQFQMAAQKAAAEAEKKRQAMDSERRKLDDEIAAMKTMFEQKMKEIEERRKELEKPGAVVPVPAPPARPPPPPAAEAKPATSTGAASVLAMKTDPGKPAPTPPVEPSKVLPSAGVASENSLGMKFASVGDVSFSIWQTRVKDFEVFAKAANLKSAAWKGPGFRQGPDHPVVNVTWNDAMAFCKWLTEKERKEGLLLATQVYRLPYDLEWSKAVGLGEEAGKTPEARDMGVPDLYPWGTEWPPPKGAGNYTGEETGSDVAIKGYNDGFAWTSPVGSFPPNNFGIYDPGGNVWQWCMDSWSEQSKAKVLRGASWYNGALKLSLLSSCRVHAAPDSSTDNYGFRVVRALEGAKPSRK